MVLGNVQASDSQRGTPMDAPSSITGCDRPDTAGLEALSHSRRDIIAERGAWPQRAWQLPHRNSRRKDLNLKTALRFGFPNCKARVVGEAQMQVAQLAATPRQCAQTKSSLQWSAGEEPDDNSIASTGEHDVWRQRQQDLKERDFRRTRNRHGGRERITLRNPCGRYLKASSNVGCIRRRCVRQDCA